MSAINAAWEMVGTLDARRAYDEGGPGLPRERRLSGATTASHRVDRSAAFLPDRAAASGPTAAARRRVA